MDPLTDLGVSVASEVATSLLAKIKKHVAYVYKYKENLQALEDAKVELENKRTDGNLFKEKTERELKVVGATVSQWLKDADTLDQRAENIRNNISCLNLWSRYSSSKHAWKLTQDINGKVTSAPDFGTSFDRQIAEGAKFKLRGFVDFDSRLAILNGVLDALKGEDVSMCSICGMGGIGKTTIAKKLVQRVEADCLFAKVAMVTVSENPKLEKIQEEIIELLGLKIDERNKLARANKLNDWLSNNRILLILDDVWWQLSDEDFEEVGIPLGTKGCKIVFTSRNEDECNKMGSQKNFFLEVLGDGEAWDLFTRNAGKCNETLERRAREIVRECDGLPIAIVTVASALKDKPEGVWDDSLKKLKSSNLRGISGMEKVYSRIQLSYDLLNAQEAQSCFLLCCLFPEDHNVPVENLVFYGWGLELFEGVDRLKEARDRVDSIVDKLKKSFLLLDGKGDGYVKLHDLVRDFAIMISSKDEHPYLVRCEKEIKKWPETRMLEKSSAISFLCESIKDDHPVDLRCPNLKLLQLHFDDISCKLPEDFFKGMEELKVVDLLATPPSPLLTMQKKLRTLMINNDYANGGSIWVEPTDYFREMLKDMKSLEVFTLSAASFSDFPAEIGQLRNLKCLRFHSVDFEYMPPGILSKLEELEELEMPLSFGNWGHKEESGNRVNASLNEIESLPLTRLFIHLPKGSVLAEKLVEGLTRFRISIGSYPGNYRPVFDENVLEVDGVDACDVTANWMSILVRKCDWLILRRVRELKHVMFQQRRGNDGFPCTHFSRLKNLEIENMDSLEEIWDGPYLSNMNRPCFSDLTRLKISMCPKLKSVFSLSMVAELGKLQHIDIRSCKEMEEIFYKDNGNQILEEVSEKVEHAIVLPGLKRIYLQQIPKLRFMNNGNHGMECPSLEEVIIIGCNEMEALSYRSFNAPTTKELLLSGVRRVKNVVKWLHLEQGNEIPQLKRLDISSCYEMKYLVASTDGPNDLLKAFFSPLEELSISGMDSLEEIWDGPCLLNIQPPRFTNLSQISILFCPKLKCVFPLSVVTELRQLQIIYILHCVEMEEIFYGEQIMEGQEVDDVITLPQLKQLCLTMLPKLKILYKGMHAIECPSLEVLSIENCNSMEALSYGPFKSPTTKKFRFERVRYLKDIIKRMHLEQRNGMELTVKCGDEMVYLVDIADPIQLKTFFYGLEKLTIYEMSSLEEICRGPYFFTNLTQIEIKHCRKLKHMFPLSVATQLTHLQTVNIESCEEMEYIFYTDQTEESTVKLDGKEADNAISLPQLRTLRLFELSKLRILYDGNHAMEFLSLEELTINSCDEMEDFSKGSVKAPKLKAIQINWKDYSAEGIFDKARSKTDEYADDAEDEDEDKDDEEEGSHDDFADYRN